MLFRSNDTATTEIYTPSNTLSLHDALPIYIRLDQVDQAMATIVVALPFVLPLVYFMMRRLSGDEQKTS